MNDDQREDEIRRQVLADSFVLLVGGGVLALFWFAAPWLIERLYRMACG
jgi:hypothetical protein